MRSMQEQLLLCEGFLKDKELADKWLKGKLSFNEVKCAVSAVFLDENFRWVYEKLSDYVHANPSGLGSQIKVLDQGLGIKISPVIPDSTEDQIAFLHLPTLCILCFLLILKDVYEEKIDIKNKEKVSMFIEQMHTYFTNFYSIPSGKQSK